MIELKNKITKIKKNYWVSSVEDFCFLNLAHNLLGRNSKIKSKNLSKYFAMHIAIYMSSMVIMRLICSYGEGGPKSVLTAINQSELVKGYSAMPASGALVLCRLVRWPPTLWWTWPAQLPRKSHKWNFLLLVSPGEDTTEYMNVRTKQYGWGNMNNREKWKI